VLAPRGMSLRVAIKVHENLPLHHETPLHIVGMTGDPDRSIRGSLDEEDLAGGGVMDVNGRSEEIPSGKAPDGFGKGHTPGQGGTPSWTFRPAREGPLVRPTRVSPRGPSTGPVPDSLSDHLANERTFLAWVRTSIAVMGLGFIVARFGLFLREFSTGSSASPSLGSELVGVLLVLLGSLLVGLAGFRFRRVQKGIDSQNYEHPSGIDLVLAGVLVAVGIALAAYLVATG
jgi:putative membrane protein